MGLLGLSAFLLVAAFGAQALMETPGQKSCLEIRDSVERMLYSTFKGSLPRGMLKDVLPGMVGPLMPAMCQEAGGDPAKWIRQQLDKMPASSASSSSSSSSASSSPSSSSIHRLSRPKRQLGMGMFNPFMMMPGMMMPAMMGMGTGPKVKDPGDHPPPGMPRHLFKDPGDHLPQLMGFRKIKDPQDRTPPPPGEGAAASGAGNPMMQMMRMMQMMNLQRQMSRMFNRNNNNNGRGGTGNGGGGTSGGKPRNGRVLGDIVPGKTAA